MISPRRAIAGDGMGHGMGNFSQMGWGVDNSGRVSTPHHGHVASVATGGAPAAGSAQKQSEEQDAERLYRKNKTKNNRGRGSKRRTVA